MPCPGRTIRTSTCYERKTERFINTIRPLVCNRFQICKAIPLLSPQPRSRILPCGATILLGRDYLGRITEITDPSGNRLRYTYDGFGNLASFTNQIELTTRYIYHTNPRHYLDEAYDSFDRRVLKAVYDEYGRFLHVLDAAGNKVNARRTQS